MKKCKVCGVELLFEYQIYCSKECINKEYKDNLKCMICGDSLPPKSERYCDKCYLKTKEQKKCVICGVGINNKNKKYCGSLACGNKAQEIRSRKYHVILYCKICGVILPSGHRKYCKSILCIKEKNKKQYERNKGINLYDLYDHGKYNRCGKCRLLRPVGMFNKDKKTFTGLNWQCNKCRQEYESRKGRKLKSEYWLNNRKYILVNRRKREQERLKTDPVFKMKSRMRILLHRVIKKCGGDTKIKDGRRSEEIFGWTIEEFVIRIESLWQPGMTWNNYGMGDNTWQIDHIKPVAAFDKRDMIDFDSDGFKECWALDNLQPLWSDENLQKNDYYKDDDYDF